MCKYCEMYGDGNKWYLNPENYDEEKIKEIDDENEQRNITGLTGSMIDVLAGPQKMDYEVGMFGQHVDKYIPDIYDEEALEGLGDIVREAHGGQVVTIDEAEQIVDLTKGEILAIPCYCRKYYGGEEKMTCFWLYPVSERTPEERPWENHEVLSEEEAKERLREYDEKGFSHGVYWAPLPLPIVICNCEMPYCIALRARLNYNVTDGARKGHSVGIVDVEKCSGCKECLEQCHFGALRFDHLKNKANIDIFKCFGCGVCRAQCPEDAIYLKERKEIPSVKDEW